MQKHNETTPEQEGITPPGSEWPPMSLLKTFHRDLEGVLELDGMRYTISGCVFKSNERRQIGISASFIFNGITEILPDNISQFKSDIQRLVTIGGFSSRYRLSFIEFVYSNDCCELFARVQAFFIPLEIDTIKLP